MADPPTRAESETSPREGWLVLGVLAIALIGTPWALILMPGARAAVGTVGFSFRDAYLVVPLVPAIGLGLIGVWTAIRSRRPD